MTLCIRDQLWVANTYGLLEVRAVLCSVALSHAGGENGASSAITERTLLYELICAVPVWQYGPSICIHGHEAIQGLPGSNNTRKAPKVILVIMCMRCLFVELNIVADLRVYGNLNLGHRGRVLHIGVGELGHC